MKVLLRRNVTKLGQIGEVVEVKDGYARNYLLPQGLAIMPNKANVKKVEGEKQAYLEELARRKAELETQARLLEGREFTIVARANEEGHLYGSVGPAQIASQAAKEGIMLEADYVILDEQIRLLGEYEVNVSFSEEVRTTVKLKVMTPEGRTGPIVTEEPAPPPAAEPASAGAGENAQAAPAARAEAEQAEQPKAKKVRKPKAKEQPKEQAKQKPQE